MSIFNFILFSINSFICVFRLSNISLYDLSFLTFKFSKFLLMISAFTLFISFVISSNFLYICSFIFSILSSILLVLLSISSLFFFNLFSKFKILLELLLILFLCSFVFVLISFSRFVNLISNSLC